MMICHRFFLLTVAFLAFYSIATVATATSGRNICDICACSPDNVAPTTVNCLCSNASRTKLPSFRPQDAEVLSSARELTLAGYGLVSLPPSGLTASKSLARVTVRDMKLFHYTAGLFPALESLTIEDIGELVLDGFGPANRTLRYLTLRRIDSIRLVAGTVTAASPLRRVILDRVNVDEIETGALDMMFVGHPDNGQSSAADGFTVVNCTIKSVKSGGVTVRSGAVRILNSTLDELAANAVVADEARDVVRLSGNRLGAMVGNSVIVLQSDGGDVIVDGNAFRTLPADMQPLKLDRSVEFRDNSVDNVDLSPFLFGLGAGVRVAGNRFVCDCDQRRISVLKMDQVFPGLLSDADNRMDQLLADNGCQQPANTTLAGYRDMLIGQTVCKGATAAVTGPSSTTDRPAPTANGVAAANLSIAAWIVALAVIAASCPRSR
ncbi:uncharacterized protein LOC112693218 [Sipha flava]|uniref:Uncharacterized protein LOC112693218 n=1 Tax=Sipha flava TaxID=143950 RepID=A0A8B8GL55_9HEMI|nr:uncharacterized protein LOC112693218 [Sipha flava]